MRIQIKGGIWKNTEVRRAGSIMLKSESFCREGLRGGWVATEEGLGSGGVQCSKRARDDDAFLSLSSPSPHAPSAG